MRCRRSSRATARSSSSASESSESNSTRCRADGECFTAGRNSANLLRTTYGPRWIDFDTACHGPLEFDLAHLGPEAAHLFPEADPERLAITRQLVSAEVSIWCWHTFGRAPEVDEAARYHLELLKG